jgi:tripartite-type tricarboxylate transporter receptor subunit TctC
MRPAALWLSVAPTVWAQSAWPNKPVKIVVPFTPGGTTDILARAIAPDLSKAFGQQFVIENKGGAGGNLGAEQVAKSAGDGYTLLMTISSSQAINPALYKNPGFDPVKDFKPVALIGAVPNVLLANPGFTGQSVQDLIAAAKAKPGQLQYARPSGMRPQPHACTVAQVRNRTRYAAHRRVPATNADQRPRSIPRWILEFLR